MSACHRVSFLGILGPIKWFTLLSSVENLQTTVEENHILHKKPRFLAQGQGQGQSLGMAKANAFKAKAKTKTFGLKAKASVYRTRDIGIK